MGNEQIRCERLLSNPIIKQPAARHLLTVYVRHHCLKPLYFMRNKIHHKPVAGAPRPSVLWRRPWACLTTVSRVVGAVRVRCVRLLTAATFLLGGAAVQAHPHAFVDGGIDFVISDRAGVATLDALHVTWLLDEFETLYMLSAAKVGLNSDGLLDSTDREAFTEQMRAWLANFDGSAHARHGASPIALEQPRSLEVAIVDGRLKLTFDRMLSEPLAVSGQEVEVGFYERTYFYAHTVTQPAKVKGAANACEARTFAFDPDSQSADLQATLQQLGREDVPDDTNVGVLFADRVLLQCD